MDAVRDLEAILATFGTCRKEGDLIEVLDPVEGGNVELCLKEKLGAEWGSLPGRMQTALGWGAAHFISAWGTTRAPVNHRYLGRIALALARRFKGLIHLLTLCLTDDREPGPEAPPELLEQMERYRQGRHPEDKDLPESMLAGLEACKDAGPWLDDIKRWLREKAREHAARSPGRVVELEDDEGEPHYLVDADFMEAWLDDPRFSFE